MTSRVGTGGGTQCATAKPTFCPSKFVSSNTECPPLLLINLESAQTGVARFCLPSSAPDALDLAENLLSPKGGPLHRSHQRHELVERLAPVLFEAHRLVFRSA